MLLLDAAGVLQSLLPAVDCRCLPPPHPSTHTTPFPTPAPYRQVDIGAVWDALLPVCGEEQWDEAGGFLALGSEVEVRVHRMRDPLLYRFPIQVWSVYCCLLCLLCWAAQPGLVLCLCGGGLGCWAGLCGWLHAQAAAAGCLFLCPLPKTNRPTAARPACRQVAAVQHDLAEVLIASEEHLAPMDLRAMTM